MPDADSPRLIEVAFPLKQASLDSVHEKNVRHGHISTLHIWPARRPLAACRAALIATLLPDPGTPEKRQELLEKIGGRVVSEVQKNKVGGKTVEVVRERTEGGVLHWGNENSPDMDWFRDEIRKAYGGRAPRVIDPFAGGGAIPLEAMRLGCEATAIDINPVAWFILKCTLEYPQKLAGQTRPLPQFALKSPEFMEAFLKGSGKLGKKQVEKELAQYQQGLFPPPEADLAWHVRAWGWWVLQQARKDLERFYPTIDGKPTVAYLWARTVTCKNCRANIPLLKTRWLCKKDNNRVVLTMEPNADKSGVVFGIHDDVPIAGGNAAQRREYDKRVGAGTMSRSGGSCPCCSTILTWEDLRLEGKAHRFGNVLHSVVCEGADGKEFRLPSDDEVNAASDAANHLAVTGTWPIATEMRGGIRNIGRASLASSVWLVCKKRSESARPGWDNRVLEEMRHNIHTRLRDYWDTGIRGPDFVWAATGPAMEAYSKHPVVKKANEPGKLMEVSEFLRAVRRLVVDFVVGRVLTGGDETSASGLDDVTTYYIHHRHDFGTRDAPVGPCILYAISCNLSDRDLADRFEILLRTGGLSSADDDDEVDEGEETDADAEPEEGTGSIVKLRPWHQRKRKSMGFDTEGRPAPLIDQVHRLMHLWKAGDVANVDDYLDSRGLRKNALFLHLLQALIELSRRDEQRDETVILENLSNHLQARGVAPTRPVTLPGFGDDDQNEAGSE